MVGIRRIIQVLREETVGGAILLAAAAIALIWANSPWARFLQGPDQISMWVPTFSACTWTCR